MDRDVNIDDPLEIVLYLGMQFGIRYLSPRITDDQLDDLTQALYNIQTTPASVLAEAFREGALGVRAEFDKEVADAKQTEVDKLEKMLDEPEDEEPEAA